MGGRSQEDRCEEGEDYQLGEGACVEARLTLGLIIAFLATDAWRVLPGAVRPHPMWTLGPNHTILIDPAPLPHGPRLWPSGVLPLQMRVATEGSGTRPGPPPPAGLQARVGGQLGADPSLSAGRSFSLPALERRPNGFSKQRLFS